MTEGGDEIPCELWLTEEYALHGLVHSMLNPAKYDFEGLVRGIGGVGG